MKRTIPVALAALILSGGLSASAWAHDKRDDTLKRRAEVNALKAHSIHRHNAPNYISYHQARNNWQAPPHGKAWGHRKQKKLNRWQYNRLPDRFHNRFGF